MKSHPRSNGRWACALLGIAVWAAWAQTSTAQLRQTAYVKASNPHMGDHFGSGGPLEGHALAVSGDGNTMAVGAPYESSAAKGINGDQNDNSAYGSGAVYVFTRGAVAWTQQAYIKASNTRQGARFGYSLSLSQDGNTLAVGAVFEGSGAKGINGNQNDDSVPQSGAAYVFTRSGGAWSQQAYIKASNTGEAGAGDDLGDGDQFGFSLSLSADGNTLAVGAISEDSGAKGINGDQNDNSQMQAGGVYVYARTGTAWSQQAYVKAANSDTADLFGYSVGLSADGNTMAVAAYDEDGSSRVINGPYDRMRRGSGAIYVFTRTGAAWAQQAYLKASNAENGDSMGYSVAISQDGNTIAAGAADEDCLKPGINPPGCDDDVKTDKSTGAVYVFVRSGTMWSQQAFIKASNPGEDDWFGARIALSGDGNSLAVGAQVEDGGAQGINGKPGDTAEDAGALYLFRRSGAAWSQQAYVKGSNTKAYDEFGSAMALSRDGTLLAVSARNEGGGSKGVNGDQNDRSISESGAVYVFLNQ